MKFTYKTKGVCSQSIDITIEKDIVTDVVYYAGCNGNLQGIGKLISGMKVDDIISKLEGIRCGYKSTSCPDQLATALKEYKQKMAE